MNKAFLNKQVSNLTIEKIVKDNCKSISILEKEIGATEVEKGISYLIADVYNAFGKQIDEHSVLQYSRELIGSYYYLALEDFLLITYNLKRKRINKICLNSFLRDFEKHAQDRAAFIEHLNYNDYLKYK